MESPYFTSPFENIFAQLEDTRHPRLVHYPLNEVLFLVLVGSLCGCDQLTSMTVFGEEKLEWLRKYYAYKNGIPSHDTLGRVLGLIDKKHFERLFVEWVDQNFERPPKSLLHLDGKHLSGSANNQDKVKKKEAGGKYSEMILNIYASGAGLTLAHHNFTESMSEPVGALEILDWLQLEGCCISADSNFCRRKIVDKIIDKKADYLLALKGNAKLLYEATMEAFENPASNLSVIRKMALNILKTHPSKGAIKAKQLRCAISDQKRNDMLNLLMR